MIHRCTDCQRLYLFSSHLKTCVKRRKRLIDEATFSAFREFHARQQETLARRAERMRGTVTKGDLRRGRTVLENAQAGVYDDWSRSAGQPSVPVSYPSQSVWVDEPAPTFVGGGGDFGGGGASSSWSDSSSSSYDSGSSSSSDCGSSGGDSGGGSCGGSD